MPSRVQRAAAARARAARAARAQSAAAAAAADAAAAAADAAPEPEPEESPAPAPNAAPETPARPPRTRPARGARCAVPCLGCLRFALAGRFTGKCFDAAVGSRCWRCTSGHTCTPVYEVDRFRAAVRIFLEGKKEKVTPAAPTGGPAAVRA
ncbi:hypothetical protein DL770_003090 [Monosporascus sp. CRB-9-2]|nr:hypothetical protein DL770_003090 [Monosporascus sp. CRB-9-2]